MKLREKGKTGRKILLILILPGLVLSLAACGPREPGSGSAEQSAAGAVSAEGEAVESGPAEGEAAENSSAESSLVESGSAEDDPVKDGSAQAEVHVAPDGNDETGDGTPETPFAGIGHAAEAAPGGLILVHEGVYGPVCLGPECSGTEASPTVIRAAEGESVLIRTEEGSCISLVNVSHIMIDGLETEGGSRGIEYRSTRDAGEQRMEDVSFCNCRVRGVRGEHGICVYGENDLAPVSSLTIEGCEVWDCACGSSESVVLNGNIDGFLIAGNSVHDNDNIGIDMIGFEGTAKHPEEDGSRDPYEADLARNGVCRDNVVYNISTEGNAAYLENGVYDLCAGGIYVDGGRDIEICNNFIFNCDIGLEAATEHSHDDNELFRVTGIRVHDNVIAGCRGWCGLCFGGYEQELGFTEDCEFDHNTLADNAVQIGVQRSRNNRVSANLIIGGETGVEFSEDCRREDMVNEIAGNAAAGLEDPESWSAEYGEVFGSRSEIADGFRSLQDNIGSRFLPDDDMIELYEKATSDCGNANAGW